MIFKNLLNSGWLHAMYISFISFPLGAVSQKFLVSHTDSNILVYTALFMLGSAAALLIMAGPGELAISTLRRVESWGYSLLQILSLIFFLLIIKYVSATEGAALGIVSCLFALASSYLFLRQPVNRYEVLGALGILLGVFVIIYNANLDVESKFILTFIVLARALFQGSQTLITEVHKTNKKAISFKSQIRVTGFIMALAGFMFLVFLLVMAFFKDKYQLEFLQPLPNYADFADLKVFVLAVCLGFFIVSISKFCEFYAGKTIGAKYLSSILSLHILFVYFLEQALVKFNLIEATIMTENTILALCLILFGNLTIAFSGFIKDMKFIEKGKKQDTLANLDDNFIKNKKDFNLLKLNISNLFTLYDKDSKKLALAIDLDRVLLDNILNYDFDEIHIKNKTAKKINNFASQQVGNKDKLTKAYNRYYLDHKVNTLLKEETLFKLYYLDLNKFKPINDTYGHEVGDYVLKETVNKFYNLGHFKELVFRVGGDEFVLIQLDNIADDLSDLIRSTIEEPIDHNGIPLEISTSIGLVHSSNYDSFEELLHDADQLMFKNKEERGGGR